MINIIAAIDFSGLLAYKFPNESEMRIPWKAPEDLKRFKERTTNSVVIMGRKTYESIGKPLPNRINCVISKNSLKVKNVTKDLQIYSSLREPLELYRSHGFGEGKDVSIDLLMVVNVRQDF